jgi:Magnesium chelatase, subunit ChlI
VNVQRALRPQSLAPRTLEAGKSMLARRLATILPAMSLAEALETTRIPHVAGLTGGRTALVTSRFSTAIGTGDGGHTETGMGPCH